MPSVNSRTGKKHHRITCRPTELMSPSITSMVLMELHMTCV